MFSNKRRGSHSQGPTEEEVAGNATSTVASCCSSHPTSLLNGLARCLVVVVQLSSHLSRFVPSSIGQLTKMMNPPPVGWVPDTVGQNSQEVLEDLLLIFPFLPPGHP